MGSVRTFDKNFFTALVVFRILLYNFYNSNESGLGSVHLCNKIELGTVSHISSIILDDSYVKQGHTLNQFQGLLACVLSFFHHKSPKFSCLFDLRGGTMKASRRQFAPTGLALGPRSQPPGSEGLPHRLDLVLGNVWDMEWKKLRSQGLTLSGSCQDNGCKAGGSFPRDNRPTRNAGPGPGRLAVRA